jgi:selenocysteine lyase/cysteine desulfurase
MDIPATLRMSLSIYNTKDDIDRFFMSILSILAKGK